MKRKIFLLSFMTISFLCLSMLVFTSMVSGATSDYSIGVSEGDEQSYEVLINDVNDVYGEVGDFIIVSILEIEEFAPESIGGKWVVTLHAGSSDDPKPQDLNYDPSHINKLTLILLICPIAVEDYLEDAAAGWDAVYPGIATASGNSWELDASDTTEYGGFSANEWEVTYNSTTGWATSYKAFKDGTLVTELIAGAPPETSADIPGYELTVLLGVGAVSTLGIIIIMKKRK